MISHSTRPSEVAGVGKMLGGDTAGTADPNGPKGYPIPHNVVLSNKSYGAGGDTMHL